MKTKKTNKLTVLLIAAILLTAFIAIEYYDTMTTFRNTISEENSLFVESKIGIADYFLITILLFMSFTWIFITFRELKNYKSKKLKTLVKLLSINRFLIYISVFLILLTSFIIYISYSKQWIMHINFIEKSVQIDNKSNSITLNLDKVTCCYAKVINRGRLKRLYIYAKLVEYPAEITEKLDWSDSGLEIFSYPIGFSIDRFYKYENELNTYFNKIGKYKDCNR